MATFNYGVFVDSSSIDGKSSTDNFPVHNFHRYQCGRRPNREAVAPRQQGNSRNCLASDHTSLFPDHPSRHSADAVDCSIAAWPESKSYTLGSHRWWHRHACSLASRLPRVSGSHRTAFSRCAGASLLPQQYCRTRNDKAKPLSFRASQQRRTPLTAQTFLRPDLIVSSRANYTVNN